MDRFSPDFRWTMTQALAISFEAYMTARRRRFEYVLDLDVLLGDDAVLLTPAMCVEGFLPDGRGQLASPPPSSSAYNTDPWNLTGHPASRCRRGCVRTASRSVCRSPGRGSATTSC